MTKPITESAAPAADAAPERRRLTAEARKNSILAAARRAFTETGDMNGTTIKVIAEHSGISEGVIYRHFESKDQLFFGPSLLRRLALLAVIKRDEGGWHNRRVEGRLVWKLLSSRKLLCVVRGNVSKIFCSAGYT
jgi:Bacterial regulatory proteins, tetR family